MKIYFPESVGKISELKLKKRIKHRKRITFLALEGDLLVGDVSGLSIYSLRGTEKKRIELGEAVIGAAYVEDLVICTRKRLLIGEEEHIEASAFGASSIVAVGTIDGRICVRGEEKRCFYAHDGPVTALSVSDLIASGGADKKIKLRTHEGKLLYELDAHEDLISSILFYKDSLLSASRDKRIGLRDLKRKTVSRIGSHESLISSLAVSPYGLIASGDKSGKIIIRQEKIELDHGESVRGLVIDKDFLVSAGGYSIAIREILYEEEPRYRELSLKPKRKKMPYVKKLEKLLEMLKRYKEDPIGVLKEAEEEGLILDLLKMLKEERLIEQISADEFVSKIRKNRCLARALAIGHPGSMPRGSPVIL